MPAKDRKKPGKPVKSLPARPVSEKHAGAVRGGTRDVASGLPTGKRMH